MTTKSHTLWQATRPTHIQSLSKSVLSVVYLDKVANEKFPTARLNTKRNVKLAEDKRQCYERSSEKGPTTANNVHVTIAGVQCCIVVFVS